MSLRFNRWCALGVSAVACVAAGPFAPRARADEPRTVKDGVYTSAQATRGQAIYSERCTSCHGAALGGGLAPPLAGDAFNSVWGGPLSEVVNKIQNTMPANDPGKLTRQQSADLVAYMLQAGKFPAGRVELASDDAALKLITIPATETAAARPQAPGQARVFPAAGNLAQVMRGILFPSANLIFTVQTRDPGRPTPPRNQSASEDFSVFEWGSGVYTGWQVVDNAAVALAESAPLMLTPGRRCENGRPVPVTDPDWIKFTVELAEVGKGLYKASQTRKQDVVSDMTEQLADSCLHCHQVYRDRRVGAGNPVDPASQAARCVR